jgi:hypothetical protein
LFSHLQCPLGNVCCYAKTFPLLRAAIVSDKDETIKLLRLSCTPKIMPVRTNSTMKKMPIILISMLAMSLAGCNRGNELDVSAGVGVNIVRTGCPAVAVPDGTGDITLFDPQSSQDSSAIDVVATLTKLRPECNSAGDKIFTQTTFEVRGLRRDSRGARSVTLPYFSTVVQGGSAVVAKRVGQVTLQFADGQSRATTVAKAASYIDVNAARLPDDIVEKITKKRKPGDADAALDPLADPEVKAAVVRSSFELLIGFQLTEDQLRYNVTR